MTTVSLTKTATPTRKVSLHKDVFRVELAGAFTRELIRKGETRGLDFTPRQAYVLNEYKPLVILGFRR